MCVLLASVDAVKQLTDTEQSDGHGHEIYTFDKLWGAEGVSLSTTHGIHAYHGDCKAKECGYNSV